MFDLEEQCVWPQCRRGSRRRSAIVIQDEHQPYKQHLCRKSYTLPLHFPAECVFGRLRLPVARLLLGVACV
jgi:transposase-like protein